MTFHAYTKPADYILPRTGTRSNFVFDSNLVGSSVRVLLDYQGGVVSSTFTAPNGTALNGLLTDRGVKADFTPDCWDRFIGSWEVQGNKARTTATSGVYMKTEIPLGADFDISVDVSATSSAGLKLRQPASPDALYVTLDFPSARVHAIESVSFVSTTKLTGSTVIVSGTTYTLRVTAVGATVNVYLNGSLEGTFTTTLTTGTTHSLWANNDTAARFDNYLVARRNLPVATAYSVRNYDGDIIASGSVTDDYFDIADSVLKQRGNLGPYGWYRVYLTGPDHGDGQWGTAYGDCSFMRIPSSSLPANGTPTQPASGTADSDEIARGVMGMGTSRYSITNSATAAATTIAAMTPILAFAKTWQTDTASAARPRRVLVAFPNGTAGNETNVTAIVAGLKTYVTAWESRNEPNFYQPAPTWTAGEFTAFHTAVKAGDTNAQILGPGSVSFRDGASDADIAYFQSFLDAGGGAVSEAFSVHPYNCYQGDLATMRYTLGHLLTKMAAAGKSAYDLWATEQGFGWNYGGVVWPHYATRWTSLMYFAQSCITADKMRPETTAYWYDKNMGFDQFPMFWLTEAGSGPTMGPVRTMSAEIYGKTFTSELNFGTYGKNLYVGGTWTNGSTGDKVVGIQASSYGANPVRLATTGAGSFTLVDPWGNTSTLTAAAGHITVPVSELPQWVRVPSGSTAALDSADWSWGTNLCLAGTPATSATTYTGLALMNNDTQESPYAMNTILNSSLQGFRATDETFPQTVQITFANQAVNRVVVSCYAPWQYLGTLADFDLQTYDGGSTWTTRKTWTGDLGRSFHFTSGVARCKVETYWHDQYVFDYQFPAAVVCQGVRLLIRNTSFTGFDTQDTSDTGNNGQNGWGRHITIREIQAFNVPDPVVTFASASTATGSGAAYQATVATSAAAGKKISALTAITGVNLAETDEFVVVDKSDTTMASSGTDKKVTRAELRAGLGGPFAVSDAVVYVSANGSDSNEGLSPGRAKLTLQAAYAALPSTGGTMLIAPGRYDVGAGLALTRGKVVWMQGLVRPPTYILSTTVAPLTVKAAILYTSSAAVSLITTTGGTSSALMDGCRFSNLLFEISHPATLYGINADTARYGEVDHCYFFADKVTGPASILAAGVYAHSSAPGTYGGNDSSWWRIHNNQCMNMALAIMGNFSGTKYDCNQHILSQNVGLGLTHTNTSANPFISLYGAFRCSIRDNNFEAYYVGLKMDTCYICREDADGGEFVDVFLDLYNCKSLICSPLGITYGPLGSYAPNVVDAFLVRADAFVKGCVFILPTWTSGNTQRVFPPTNDPVDPSVSMGHPDNLIITSRHVTNQGVHELVGTGSPAGVVAGSVGDRYWRTDGGAGTTLYVKESGTNTTAGWVGK